MERRKLALETGDPLFVVDRQQRIVQWNGAAERLFGYTASEAIGAHCYDLLGCRASGRGPGVNCLERVRDQATSRLVRLEFPGGVLAVKRSLGWRQSELHHPF